MTFEAYVYDPSDPARRFYLGNIEAPGKGRALASAAFRWPGWGSLLRVRRQGPGVDQEWFVAPAARPSPLTAAGRGGTNP